MKEPPTRAGNLLAIATLRKVFGDMRIGELTPQDVYRFVDMRSVKNPVPPAGSLVGAQSRIGKSRY